MYAGAKMSNSNLHTLPDGMEVYKWYYYSRWDLFVMKTESVGTSKFIGIKTYPDGDYEVHIMGNLNVNEFFGEEINGGKKRSLNVALRKFSEDRSMFKKFYAKVIESIFNN